MAFNILNGTPEDVARFYYATNYLFNARDSPPELGTMSSHFFRNDVNVSFTNGPSYYDTNSNTIHWDPTGALHVIQANGQTGAMSPALVLSHELYHAYSLTKFASWDEYTATAFETKLAVALGEPFRPTYNHVNAFNPVIKVNNPTMHTRGDKWFARDSESHVVAGAAYNPSKTTEIWEVPGGGGGGGSDSTYFPGYWNGSEQSPPTPLIPGGYWNPVHPHSLPGELDVSSLISGTSSGRGSMIFVSDYVEDVSSLYSEIPISNSGENDSLEDFETSFVTIVGTNQVDLIA